MAVKLRRRLFNEAIGDEVALDGSVEPLLPALRQPLSDNDWVGLSRQYGIERATRLLYRALLAGPAAAFVEAVNAGQVGGKGPRPIRLVVVPGMFYREYPDIGADGRIVCDVAAALGLPAEVAPSKSTGSIEGNVARLRDHLARDQGGHDIWLLSISKGGSEVRRYLQSCQTATQVKGWLNIAGIPGGTPYVDMKLNNPLKRFYYRLVCGLSGISFSGVDQLRDGHPAWRESRWPEGVDMIHVVPVPLPAHVQPFLRERYRRLSPLGPNDGLVPLSHYLALPGQIYPLWGVDHFMRTAELSRLLYRFFHYITQAKDERNLL